MKKAKTHLSRDPVMLGMIESISLPTRKWEREVFTALLRSIVYQQLSGKAAGTIYGRLLDLFAGRKPDPKKLSRMSESKLRSVGLSKQKTGYVKNLAKHWIQNDLAGTNWSKVSDEDFVDEVTQIKGVGVWTAQMVLMFTLKRPDVLPLNDLAICKAIKHAYRLRSKGKRFEERMVEIAEPWRPYRTLACLYLWASLADDSK